MTGGGFLKSENERGRFFQNRKMIYDEQHPLKIGKFRTHINWMIDWVSSFFGGIMIYGKGNIVKYSSFQHGYIEYPSKRLKGDEQDIYIKYYPKDINDKTGFICFMKILSGKAHKESKKL